MYIYCIKSYGHVVQHHQRTSPQQFYNLLYNKFVTSQCQSPTDFFVFIWEPPANEQGKFPWGKEHLWSHELRRIVFIASAGYSCWLQTRTLPLRNSASSMHFFVAKLLSIAVMTYSYIYYLRNLRSANLLRRKRINFSMRPQHVRMTRDSTVVWSLLSRESLRIPAWALYCQKPESMSYMIVAIVLVYLYLFVRNSFRKPRKDVHEGR